MRLFHIGGMSILFTHALFAQPAKNINDHSLTLIPVPPDTLIIGGFKITVAKYSQIGTWNPGSRTYTGAEGTGWVQNSQLANKSLPILTFNNVALRPLTVNVMDTVRNPNTDITIRDAILLGLKIDNGKTAELMVPQNEKGLLNLNSYLNNMNSLKRENGVFVQFRGLTIKVIKPAAKTGVVLAGAAQYPADSLLTSTPFTVSEASGFTLEISDMVFSTAPTVKAKAVLHLPSSLSSAAACAPPSMALGTIDLLPNGEFYKELPDSDYGAFSVGSTGLIIQGHGYIVDFSSTTSFLAGQSKLWKGVILLGGSSAGTPSGKVISNIGYLQANYSFSNATLTGSGLSANFICSTPYEFCAIQPLGYKIYFRSASIQVANSTVKIGSFLAEIELPETAARLANGGPIVLTKCNINVDSDMNMQGTTLLSAGEGIYWGDLVGAGGGDRKSFGIEQVKTPVQLFFSASPKSQFFPLSANRKFFVSPINTTNFMTEIVAANMQGATFVNPLCLVVNTPDVSVPWIPNTPKTPITGAPVYFFLGGYKREIQWINVASQGVNCYLHSFTANPGYSEQLGNTLNPAYIGKTPFNTVVSPDTSSLHKVYTVAPQQDTTHSILLECIESAVFACNLSGQINLPKPANCTLPFQRMVFTSTANTVGGQVIITSDDSLAYWGVKLVKKPGYSSAGLISVKTGQIILSAAGISEIRHFALPFWLTWGEMLANGSMGRLFFDFNPEGSFLNAGGQQFDGFNFTTSSVALSPYVPGTLGYLQIAGTAHFPFFGGNYLNIQDQYKVGGIYNNAPYRNHVVQLITNSSPGFLPTNRNLQGNWQNGLGIFNINIDYNQTTQNGFEGTGSSLLSCISSDSSGLSSTLDMSSRGTCIRFGNRLNQTNTIALGPVANIAALGQVWGCVCIQNNDIVNIVVQGQLVTSANISIAVRTGAYVSAILQITPSLTQLTLDGQATLSLLTAVDVDMNGHVQLTFNYGQGYLEGEINGNVSVEAGAVLVGGSLTGQGQLNWHFGLDYQEIEGMLSMQVMGFGSGAGVQGGFYLANNAPKSGAWVLIGADPKFALDMDALPSNLTGIYGMVHIEEGINLWIASGSYEIFAGLGAFILTPEVAGTMGGLLPAVGLPYVIGNLGGGINAEILGGLVSAGASFDFQLIGPYPFSFQGTVGLEGCVLWVACGSIDLTVGLNSSKGFYIN